MPIGGSARIIGRDVGPGGSGPSGQRTGPDQPRGPIPTRVKMLRHHQRSAANTTQPLLLLCCHILPLNPLYHCVIICGEDDWLLVDENLENETMMRLESEEGCQELADLPPARQRPLSHNSISSSLQNSPATLSKDYTFCLCLFSP